MQQQTEIYTDIYQFIQSLFREQNLQQWFIDTILKRKLPICPHRGCKRRMVVIHEHGVPKTLRCLRCRTDRSIFYKTNLYRSRLDLCQTIFMFVLLYLRLPQKTVSQLSGITRLTVSHYQVQARIMLSEFVSGTGIKLGGPGRTVQIDEALLCHRKYNRGRQKRQIWIFGAIDSNSPKFSNLFLMMVPDRTARTLIPIICQHVLPGTTIISDEWKAYSPLDIMSEYEHLTVNHSETFLDRTTGACTNKIEGVWSHLRRFLPQSGFNEKNIPAFLSQFMLIHQGAISLQSFVEGMCLFKQQKRKHESITKHEEADVIKHETTLEEEDKPTIECSASSSCCGATTEEEEEQDSDVPVLADCFDSSSDMDECTRSSSDSSSDGAGSGGSASEWEN